ncbi:MAG: 16S rRNA (guanine(966)-N(2))-methyltransferase RsmD [Ignavibacteria bacterium]|nr:16S rRNA (guanine(966)-N(2))-methyltransferase RsmD [Ignavibacteria bacterium]
MKMRIISGEAKGRQFFVPKSDLVRPTTDRVRETLFNLVSNRISFEGIKVLDLYAGSGALGLECISRGAAEVNFVDINLTIIKNLERNIDLLNAKKKCKVFKMSALNFSLRFENPGYDLILADPPFFKEDIYKVFENLLANRYLNPGSDIIIERSIQTKEKDIENFRIEPFKKIGDTCLYSITY